jgi:endonuclease YncB( thermonuclease family)
VRSDHIVQELIVLGSITPSRPPPRRLRHQLWRINRWCRRSAIGRWLPVLLVLAGLAAGTLMPASQAHRMTGWLRDASSELAVGVQHLGRPDADPSPRVLRPRRVAGGFRLCAERRHANCVIDGDTIRYGGVKIRLADIDTPEVFSPKCPDEASLGRQATGRLQELLNAGPVGLMPIERDADRYGRKLRVVTRNGRSLGDILVAEGLARRWDGRRRSWCG